MTYNNAAVEKLMEHIETIGDAIEDSRSYSKQRRWDGWMEGAEYDAWVAKLDTLEALLKELRQQ